MAGSKGGGVRASGSNLRAAFMASPGPRTLREAAMLWLKGVCMGGADIIPGVSGGTIAFITGIYSQLVDAIRSFDTLFVRRLLRLDLAGALAEVHLRFLACLLFGILTAVVTMAGFMNYMLNNRPVEIWSLFFGLIAASIFVVGREIKPFNAVNLGFVLLGTVGSYLLVGMIPVSTPESLSFIFLCGSIAICAMILPGISGAFLLLMLGKYEYVTRTLKNPFLWDNFVVIAAFAAGAAVGIVLFSRVLHFLLNRWHAATVSVLTGFMIGALRKVWPWKEVLESAVIRGKMHVLRTQNVLPDGLSGEVALALVLFAAGVLVVIVLERLSNRVQ
jgi:putative membrane protein